MILIVGRVRALTGGRTLIVSLISVKLSVIRQVRMTIGVATGRFMYVEVGRLNRITQ